MRTGFRATVLFCLPCRRLAALVCALLLCGAALAAPTSPLRFKRMTSLVTDDMSVTSLLQDRQGFVWIGTLNGGLYRYDGYHARKFAFDPANAHSLPGDRVTMVHENQAGQIWVSTREGLARFNPDSGDFTRFEPATLPGVPRVVTKILPDGERGMWLSTWAGLQHFDPSRGVFSQMVHDDTDPDSVGTNGLDAMVRDRHGGIWVATWPAGFDYLAPGTRRFRHFRLDSTEHPDSLMAIVYALHIDAQDRLWIGTGRGVWRWNMHSDWDSRSRIDSPESRVNAFYAEADGSTVWAGTMTAGLLRWDGQDKLTTFGYRASDPYSLPTLSIASVMRDRAGTLWVGSYNAGISVANLGTRGFARLIPPEIGEPDPHPNNTLQAIAGAPDGRVWLGGLNGVVLYNPASGMAERSVRADPARPGSMASDVVSSLYQQDGGPLWVGTGAALHRVDPATGMATVIHLGPRAADRVNTVVAASGRRLWVGTADQVILYDPTEGVVRRLAPEKGNPNSRSVDNASTILEDRQGRVWIGSEYTNGLDMLDLASGRFQHFRHVEADQASLLDDAVSALHQDQAGRLWAGTGKGLIEIRTSANGSITFHHRREAVGLARVFSINSDAHGGVWLATTSSLTRFDPATAKASTYTANDGLIDSYRAGPAYRAPDGRLMFIGSAGASVVDPAQVQLDSVPPQVAITDISVANQSLGRRPLPEGVQLDGPLTAARTLELGPQHSVFALEFAALHFNEPSQNRYAYRLVGFDHDWIDVDAANRRITYTNLSPGHYVFKVRASNDRGLWREEPASLAITILPPFWHTWWFRTAAVLLVLAMLVTAYRLRMRSFTRRGEKLSALVAERTRALEESNAKLAQSNAKLAALSLTDGLTGVTNRRGFDTAVADEWTRARRAGHPLSLVMFDVDHFKLFNDHYGHLAGDACLRAVAGVIAAYARRAGDVAARYGGEEFALLLPASDRASALALAQEVCSAIADLAMPHALSPHQVATASAGVATLDPHEELDTEALVRAADQALYRAKQAGRNVALAA
jgi:diguanylate cyclase (GGDEF)-like protein